jgi:hypothetical protein
METKTFRTESDQRVVGIFVYLILGPVMALMVAVMAGGLALALYFFIGETLAVICGAALFLLALVGITTKAFREYRMRAGAQVRVDQEGIRYGSGRSAREIAYSDLEEVQYLCETSPEYRRLILRTRQGSRLEMPGTLPLEEIYEAMEPGAAKALAKGIRARLEEKEQVRFPEPKSWARRAGLLGLGAICFGGLWTAGYFIHQYQGTPKPYALVGGLSFLVIGALKVGYYLRARHGGLAVSLEGLMELRKGIRTDWQHVEKIQVVEREAIVVFRDSDRLVKLTRTALNFIALEEVVKYLVAMGKVQP